MPLLNTLNSPNLFLRPIIDSDIENIFKGLSHPEVIKYYGVNYNSLEATKEQMEWYAQPSQYWWAICSVDGKEFYGAGGLNDISKEHKKAEIGLWLLPEYWGQGNMKEAMPLIYNFGFGTLGLHSIEGFVDSRNIGCIKALKRLDFVYSNTLIEYTHEEDILIYFYVYTMLNKSIHFSKHIVTKN